MKCPKCSYLGFETGDRCKNCGYDFSLMADAGPERIEIDLDLRGTDPPDSGDWLADVEAGRVELRSAPEPAPEIEPVPMSVQEPVPEPVPEPVAEPVAESAPVLSVPAGTDELPLFMPAVDDGGDEPLIKVPPVPRPPLAVRRTPETPRLRAVPPQMRRIEPDPTPALQFDGESSGTAEPRQTPESITPPIVVRPRVSRVWAESGHGHAAVSPPSARAAAAAIDHLMLGGIDLAVLYFTLRMAGLPMDQWSVLPAVPLVAFLLFIKLSYFCAFTAVGGQTIGKMAARIRVVGVDDHPVDAALALRRTLAGVLSAALLGLGFLPALFGADRRALHDRVARTRVIALPSA